jgi:hypothetical protein
VTLRATDSEEELEVSLQTAFQVRDIHNCACRFRCSGTAAAGGRWGWIPQHDGVCLCSVRIASCVEDRAAGNLSGVTGKCHRGPPPRTRRGATAVICARHLLPAARVAPEGDSLSRAPIIVLTVADSEASALSLGTASLQISAEDQPAERARVAASMQAAPTLQYLALARANQARASQSLVKASVC